jgi:putative membrane protein
MRRNGIIRWITALTAGGFTLVLGAPAVRAQAYPPPAPAIDGGGKSSQGWLKSDDYDFVVKASRINMEEVQLGELAEKKSNNPEVRSFAERIVRDHSQSNTRLQELATQKGAAVPTEMSRKEDATIQHLESLSGAAFDKAFAEHMVKGHKHAIKEYKSAAKDMSDADLRTLAETTLPVLEEHLSIAEQLEKTVKSEK